MPSQEKLLDWVMVDIRFVSFHENCCWAVSLVQKEFLQLLSTAASLKACVACLSVRTTPICLKIMHISTVCDLTSPLKCLFSMQIFPECKFKAPLRLNVTNQVVMFMLQIMLSNKTASVSSMACKPTYFSYNPKWRASLVQYCCVKLNRRGVNQPIACWWSLDSATTLELLFQRCLIGKKIDPVCQNLLQCCDQSKHMRYWSNFAQHGQARQVFSQSGFSLLILKSYTRLKLAYKTTLHDQLV